MKSMLYAGPPGHGNTVINGELEGGNFNLTGHNAADVINGQRCFPQRK